MSIVEIYIEIVAFAIYYLRAYINNSREQPDPPAIKGVCPGKGWKVKTFSRISSPFLTELLLRLSVHIL